MCCLFVCRCRGDDFSFTAESEREKEEWVETIQESIAETLSDYEVAEKIWFNEANRLCADCHAPRPEWASVNLGVVICKKCAGQAPPTSLVLLCYFFFVNFGIEFVRFDHFVNFVSLLFYSLFKLFF